MRFLILALVLFSFWQTEIVLAQESTSPFTICEGTECSACNVVDILNQGIIWLFGFVFLIFMYIMVVAGFGLVTSAGNTSALESAKNKFKNGIIGLVIIMAAWIFVDTIMRTLVGGGAGDGVSNAPVGEITGWGPWSQVKCQTQTPTVAAPPGGGGVTPVDPNDPQCTEQALRQRYSGSPQSTDAPGLSTLISCYLNDPAIADAVDRNQIYTYERTEPRCAWTNGNAVPACGISSCAHSVNSCHYGRGQGQGAMAVDFNARSGVSEAELNALIRERVSVCGGRLLQEGSHTHISMPSC